MNSGMDGHKVVSLSAIDKSLVKKGYEYESGEKRKEEKLLSELADCLCDRRRSRKRLLVFDDA
jgi:hypothetical protein